jgi:hypothetical protein
MEATYSFETSVDFQRLYEVRAKRAEQTSNPTYLKQSGFTVLRRGSSHPVHASTSFAFELELTLTRYVVNTDETRHTYIFS